VCPCDVTLAASHSVNDLVALARDASMSTSYKPALLKALARVVVAAPATRISLEALGAEFVRLYWNQTVVYHLRQASVIGKEPEVLSAIRATSARYRTRHVSILPQSASSKLSADMARILRIDVLERFHRSAPARMTPLFTWSKPDRFISLDVASIEFIIADAATIVNIANHWWARYLERVNRLAPSIIEKVERDGARRGSLGRYLRILGETDDARCFYCERSLDADVMRHVDHVIPWSFLLSDELWDLVLSCAPCNMAKSDVLPARPFLSKLVALNERRSRLSLPPGLVSPLVPHDEIFRLYDAALAVEWPRDWSPRSDP
jgi:hypothetical protein